MKREVPTRGAKDEEDDECNISNKQPAAAKINGNLNDNSMSSSNSI